MRNILSSMLLASAAVAVMSMPAHAGVTVYTDEAAFLAAAGPTTLEDFNDTTLATGLSFTSTVGAISGGLFNDQLDPAGQTTTFSFAPGIKAFGGNFDLTPGGPGIGIAFTLAPGGLVGSEVPNTYSGQFFGFISTTAFTSVELTGGTQTAGVETYNLDNLHFGGAVPEPSSWALVIAGAGLAGCALRMRRKAVLA